MRRVLSAILAFTMVLSLSFAGGSGGGLAFADEGADTESIAVDDDSSADDATPADDDLITEPMSDDDSLGMEIDNDAQAIAPLAATTDTDTGSGDSEPELFLVGYRLWDANWDYVQGKEITGTLNPTVMIDPNNSSFSGAGNFVWYAALTFDRPVAITSAEDVLAQLNLNGVLVSANKITTVYIDPLDPCTVIIRAQDKPTTTSAQAFSRTTISPKAASRFVDAIYAADDPGAHAYMTFDINSISSTGLKFEKVAETIGTESTPASVTYKLSSISLIRCANQMKFMVNGVQVGSNFAVHSHSPWTIGPENYITTLTGTGNQTTFDNLGYAIAATTTESGEPAFTITAKTAVAGEVLGWQMDQFPTCSIDDRRIEIVDALKTSVATNEEKAAAVELLRQPVISAEDIDATLLVLTYTGGGGVQVPPPSITYQTHVQNVGWQAVVSEGQMSGTSGQSLRLEGLKINMANTSGYAGGISYSTHIQNIGWQQAVSLATTGASDTEVKGELSGTTGQSLRLEAVRISLTGELASHYDIYYRVHAQDVGWMGWAKNGGDAGTAGHSLRLEALQIVIVPKGGTAPSVTLNGINTVSGTPVMIDPTATYSYLGYSAVVHIQNTGDKSYDTATGSTILGTTGQSLRLEAIKLSLRDAPVAGSVSYEVHVQNIGWQGVKPSGEVAGTSGQSLRLEAIRIELTGEMANQYDIYYRTHIQNIGWTGWAKNGQSCGSAGYAYRMEAMQIVIVPQGTAPGLNAGYFYQR